MNGFEISDTDQLILAIYLDLGLFWFKKLDLSLTVSLSGIKTLNKH